MSDAVIARQEHVTLPERGPVSLLHFHSGLVLMVAAESVGLYKERQAVVNPLGHALGVAPIPPAMQPEWHTEKGYIVEQQAGFVRLGSGAVLFLRPDGVALYPDSAAALRNLNMQWLLPYR